MTYIPYSPEIGAKYTLKGPDGTVAVFNDPTDPNYVGKIDDITGLDSADVRESADVLVEVDGGWHGNFYYGRRPITVSGTVAGYASADTRTTRLDRLRRASNAMRSDANLSWLNTGLSAVPMQTSVRRQQPLRISGAWIKTFQLQLVSQFAPLFSVATHQQSNYNLYNFTPNPSFEISGSGTPNFPTDYTATNGTITQSITQAYDGPHSAQITANGSGPIDFYKNAVNSTLLGTLYGDNWFGPPFGNDYTHTFSFRAYGATTGRTWVCKVVWFDSSGTVVRTDVGTPTASDAGTWVRAVLTTVAPPGASQFSLHSVTTTTPANGEQHYIDDVAATNGPELLSGSPINRAMTLENQGDCPAYPLLAVNGDPTPPAVLQVTNNTTGAVVKMLAGYVVGTGNFVLIDTLNHTAKEYAGVFGFGTPTFATDVTGSIDFAHSTWPALVTGDNQFVGPPTSGRLTVAWQDAWT